MITSITRSLAGVEWNTTAGSQEMICELSLSSRRYLLITQNQYNIQDGCAGKNHDSKSLIFPFRRIGRGRKERKNPLLWAFPLCRQAKKGCCWGSYCRWSPVKSRDCVHTVQARTPIKRLNLPQLFCTRPNPKLCASSHPIDTFHRREESGFLARLRVSRALSNSP
ncbi:hypothetical protein CEXT_2671 [Caerostris extrusa]|uniref:Uncharacterized protein n=1 Tax=Caerostris extrusa TaxID=172846 RepID=A0AAV4NUX1_CAEEX|nr:hypothetical protein CEXT_2671 [Caerostris extrusa]